MLSFHSTDSLIDDDNYQFHSDNMDISDPPLLGFDQDLGMTLTGNETISGFTVSSTLPDSTEWQIIRLSNDGITTNVTDPNFLGYISIYVKSRRWSIKMDMGIHHRFIINY